MVVLIEPKGQNCLEGIETLRDSTKKKEAALFKMLGMGSEKAYPRPLPFSYFPISHHWLNLTRNWLAKTVIQIL